MSTEPRVVLFALLGAASFLSVADQAHSADITAGEDAVMLEEKWDIDIRSPEDVLERYSRRLQILTPRGAEEYKGAAVGYNPWISIKDFRGSVESPNGKRFDVKKQNIVDTAVFESFVLYADSKQRVMIRSEERRVGKECRDPLWACASTLKMTKLSVPCPCECMSETA